LLHYFRINDPYRLLGLLVVLTLLYLPLWIDAPRLILPELKSFLVGEKVTEGFVLYKELIDSTPPLASWFYGLCDLVFGRSLAGRHIMGFLLLFTQSAFLAIVFINKKVFAESTYLPALLFSILAYISFDMMALTAELPALGFTLLALNNLFKEIEFKTQRDETILNLGFFISVASLFNFSYALYLPGTILILIIFTRTTPRKHLLLLFGFLLPHLVLATVYFMNDSLVALWVNFYLPNLTPAASVLVEASGLLWLCAVPLFFLMVALFVINRNAHLSRYQLQIFQAIFFWFLIGLGQLMISKDLRPQHLLPMIPPVSFFLTHYLLLGRKRKLSEFTLWVILLSVVSVAYLVRYDKLEVIRYDNLFVQTPPSSVSGSRLLILGDDLSPYRQNQLAPPFLDWSLSRQIFESPEYYENVLLVNRLFDRDLPEVIIDPKNLMASFSDRLPSLKLKYEKTDEGYQLKKINN
jgi:hypothetical protein